MTTKHIPSASEIAALESRRLYGHLLAMCSPGHRAKSDPNHHARKATATRSREMAFLLGARELIELSTDQPFGHVLAGWTRCDLRRRAGAFGAWRRNTPTAVVAELGRGPTMPEPRKMPDLLRGGAAAGRVSVE